MSDTSSISQSSYDPSKPMFSGMASEIPDSAPSALEDPSSAGGVVLLSSKTKGDAAVPAACKRLCVCLYVTRAFCAQQPPLVVAGGKLCGPKAFFGAKEGKEKKKTRN